MPNLFNSRAKWANLFTSDTQSTQPPPESGRAIFAVDYQGGIKLILFEGRTMLTICGPAAAFRPFRDTWQVGLERLNDKLGEKAADFTI